MIALLEFDPPTDNIMPCIPSWEVGVELERKIYIQN
jgi:hypothetical protein